MPAPAAGVEPDRLRRGAARWRAAGTIALLAALVGCASIGANDPSDRAAIDFGPPREIRLCILKSPGVTDARARRLVTAINDELAPFALRVVVPWTRPWSRPGFTEPAILRGIAALPLEAPCDRVVALVDRHLGDVLWGLPLLPEVVGSVETASMTRGYVVANRATLAQWWTPPSVVAAHEFYHLLGCPHAKSRRLCYRRIAALKEAARGSDFFPAMTLGGELIVTREAANARVAEWLASRNRGALQRDAAGPRHAE